MTAPRPAWLPDFLFLGVARAAPQGLLKYSRRAAYRPVTAPGLVPPIGARGTRTNALQLLGSAVPPAAPGTLTAPPYTGPLLPNPYTIG